MRQMIQMTAAIFFFCALCSARVFAADKSYTPEGNAVATVDHQETSPMPEIPGPEFLGPPSLFDDNPLKPVAKSERKIAEPEKLTPEEIRDIEEILEWIDQTVVDYQPSTQRLEGVAGGHDEFSMPVGKIERSISLESRQELKAETREISLDSAQRFPSLKEMPEQNQRVADIAGVGETQFSFPAFAVFLDAAAHLFRTKVSSVKDRLKEDSFQPLQLDAFADNGPDALLSETLPGQDNAEVLASVTLDKTIAATDYFLHAPKSAHPLHQILFYLSHVNSDDLRRYESARRKIQEINDRAKAEGLKVRYMGKFFDSFIPLLDEGGGREARRLELLAQK